MIIVTIVHNYESDRLLYLKPKLQRIIKNLSISTSITESAITTHSNPTNLDLLIRHLNLFKVRVKTLFSIQRNFKAKTQKEIIRTYWRIFRTSMKTRTQALAEIDLTGKHIAAWKSFIFSDAEYLVVLESDALIRNSKKFQMFLRSLDQFEKHDYISLTWPFSNELLGLSQTAPLKNKTYFTINFQLTNTCAGYILSKDLAQKLLEKAENGRVERKIAIDWFMNQMFAELRKREKWNMRTIVPNQELVINGSMVGEYVSGIQK